MGMHTAPGPWTGSRRGRRALAVAVATAGAGTLAASLAGTANAAPAVHHDGPPVAGTHHGGALTAEHHGHHSHRDRDRDRATRSYGCPAPQTATGSTTPDTAVTSILHGLLGAPATGTAPGAPTGPALGTADPRTAAAPRRVGGSARTPTRPAGPTPAAPPTPPGAARGAGERGARRGRVDDHPDPGHLERPERTHDHSHPGLSTRRRDQPSSELSGQYTKRGRTSVVAVARGWP